MTLVVGLPRGPHVVGRRARGDHHGPRDARRPGGVLDQVHVVRPTAHVRRLGSRHRPITLPLPLQLVDGQPAQAPQHGSQPGPGVVSPSPVDGRSGRFGNGVYVPCVSDGGRRPGLRHGAQEVRVRGSSSGSEPGRVGGYDGHRREPRALASEEELDEAEARRGKHEDGVAPAEAADSAEEVARHAPDGGVELGVGQRGACRRRVVVGPDEGRLGGERRQLGPHGEVAVDHRLVGVACVVVLGAHGRARAVPSPVLPFPAIASCFCCCCLSACCSSLYSRRRGEVIDGPFLGAKKQPRKRREERPSSSFFRPVCLFLHFT